MVGEAQWPGGMLLVLPVGLELVLLQLLRADDAHFGCALLLRLRLLHRWPVALAVATAVPAGWGRALRLGVEGAVVQVAPLLANLLVVVVLLLLSLPSLLL